MDTGAIRWTLQGHRDYVQSVVFSPDVRGLAYPAEDLHRSDETYSLENLNDYSAVQLFTQRAAQVQPGFALSEATLTTVVQICQHVAGIPLAIELAAAGVRTMPLAEIEQQIRTSLDVLATTLHNMPTRHRSMRARPRAI
jgi:predicted ATPase